MVVTLLLAGSGVLAGAFGALLGLGGGVLVVPLLTLGFGVPFREAVAISLLAVITTSSASAAVYLERRVADLRLGMTLELATGLGALVGGLIAFLVSERVLAAAFAVMLGYISISMLRRTLAARRLRDRASAQDAASPRDVDAGGALVPIGYEGVPAMTAAAAGADAQTAIATDGGAEDDERGYRVRRLPLGLSLSALAGVVSALLGIGGGAIKVPAMHLGMGVPLRVATATSNLMIGITASASAVLYVLRGTVDPYIAGPIVAGVFLGASGASRVAHRVPVSVLRALFVVVLGYVALEMAARALGISLLGVPRG